MRSHPLIAALVLGLAPGLAAAEAHVTEAPYDLLFRTGTLDDVDRGATLAYERTVTNDLVPAAAERDSGRIELTFTDGTVEEAVLTFHQDDRFRALGEFPASVGNPLILYFVETVARDMAESAGGSQFYIRNRLKESLVSPAGIETLDAPLGGGTVGATAVTLRPFEGDPNAERMRGFDELTLTVTMSDEVPGWYRELLAEVPDEGGTPIYSSVLSYVPDAGGEAQ